jgi:hypothetical protein
MDNIRRWASNPEFEKVSLSELEQLDGLLGTYFVEVEKHLPDDFDSTATTPLLSQVFCEPKLAHLKFPDASVPTEEELQRKINNPILKKHYQTLIQHFERVMYLNDEKSAP